MAKQPKSNRKKVLISKKSRNRLILIPFIAFVIKLVIIARIQGFDWFTAGNENIQSGLKVLVDQGKKPPNIWYGADAENYLSGLQALVRDGFASNETGLHYWPAGYPLLMWPLIIFFKGNFFIALSTIQSLFYAISSAFFVNELSQSRLKKFALLIAFFLALNPTLALNTIAIGYELPTVASSLIAMGALIRNFRLSKAPIFTSELVIAGSAFALAAFMQPRLILIAISFFVIWGLAKYKNTSAVIFIVLSFFIVSIGPTTLVLRNVKANGFVAISTNLGTTMNIGAGFQATGGYSNDAKGVSCTVPEGSPAQIDRHRVNCVIKWYLANPSYVPKLIWNKTLFFWSPWFGPAANGTMARNPWRIHHPLAETIKTEIGYKKVYGTSGKLISWLWMSFSFAMMIYGFLLLWRSRNFERVLGLIAISAVIVNWLSSVATIGDHRFRIPSMGMSLFLQVIGFVGIFLNKRQRFLGNPTPVDWPGLSWRARARRDNLTT